MIASYLTRWSYAFASGFKTSNRFYRALSWCSYQHPSGSKVFSEIKSRQYGSLVFSRTRCNTVGIEFTLISSRLRYLQ